MWFHSSSAAGRFLTFALFIPDLLHYRHYLNTGTISVEVLTMYVVGSSFLLMTFPRPV